MLYQFPGGSNAFPYGGPAIDSSGNLYGTAAGILPYAPYYGNVWELVPSSNSWMQKIIHRFNGPDARNPQSSVVFDRLGNLYGTTVGFGGSVFELSHVRGDWKVTNLFVFNNSNDGLHPIAAVTLDSVANVYGGTTSSRPGLGGPVFELSPSTGGWTLSRLYAFAGEESTCGGVSNSLVMDEAGNLYGTTCGDGANFRGSVFKLTPTLSGFLYTDLHDFQSSPKDGLAPVSNIVIDKSGNLYGTAFYGGVHFKGVVFKITP